MHFTDYKIKSYPLYIRFVTGSKSVEKLIKYFVANFRNVAGCVAVSVSRKPEVFAIEEKSQFMC